MEHLNKNQFILLNLLVTFVTSIATGIMTVSLLQQAPVEVTRNINNVVERTIEKVVPTNILSGTKKDVTTVVVKEEDMVIDSINKNLKSIVRIYEKNSITDTTSFYGIGLVTSKEGVLVSVRRSINPSDIYSIIDANGKTHSVAPIGIDKKTNFVLFKVNQTEKSKVEFTPATLGNSDVQLGQTIISLGGDQTNAVSVGRAITINTRDSGTGTSTVKVISSIDTDVSSRDLVLGSPLFDLSGNVVGMKTTDSSSRFFIPVSAIKSDIAVLTD